MIFRGASIKGDFLGRCKKENNFDGEIKLDVDKNAVEALALPTAGDGILYQPQSLR